MIVMGSVDFRTASGGTSVLLYFSLKVADIDLNSSLPLFRPVRLYKSPSTSKLYGTKLSYTRCREMFKSCLKDLGLDDKLYGQAPSVVIITVPIYQSDYLIYMIQLEVGLCKRYFSKRAW